MAVDIKFFLAGEVFFSYFFEGFIEVLGFFFVDLHDGAVVVDPFFRG